MFGSEGFGLETDAVLSIVIAHRALAQIILTFRKFRNGS